MRHLNSLLSLLVLLTGCDVVSPFIGEDLKATICDRDNDGRTRTSEYCGGNDCDDSDRNVGSPTDWFRDVDIDSFGAGEAVSACIQPDGYVALAGDCDDTDELVNPNSTETCNGYDDNCDGGVDDENINVWYADLDEDTYGDPTVSLTQCDEPDGYVSNDLDCDDADAVINPDGIEVCDDGIDQDCNDAVDDAEGSQVWYADVDEDNYGDLAVNLYSCEGSVDGHVLDNTDCDDAVYDISPAAFEACDDGIDNDCDGEIDTDAEDVPWYRDADEDGYGDEVTTLTDCAPPDGYVGNAQDCDDASSEVSPLAEEVCNNGVDDNCDASPNECELSGTLSLADADAIFTGVEESDYVGYSVSPAGDVNDDGVVDILIGAYSAGSNGEAYVFFGPFTGTVDTNSADITFTGSSSEIGYSVSGNCDLDGDGDVDDVVISAKTDSEGGMNAGAIWAILGPLPAGSYDLDTVGVKLTGEIYSQAGYSVSCQGDVNNDDSDDILAGAPNYGDPSATGAAYLVYGPPESGSLGDDIVLVAEAVSSLAGIAVAITPDTNSDGYDEVLVGAYSDSTEYEGAGAVYIVNGPATSMSLSDAEILLGEARADLAGYSLSSAGDLNGDTYGDFMVGSFESGDGEGKAYVVEGPVSTGSLGDEITWEGINAGDNVGYDMAGGCDINGDGKQDAVLIARYAGASDNGILYGLYDPTAGGSVTDADFQIEGEASGDAAGEAIRLFDANDDGLCDILVGVPHAGPGKTYLIYGLGY